MTEEHLPTHRLVISIPLDLSARDGFDYDPVHTALSMALSISRLATDEVLCGLVDVSLEVCPDAG